MSIAFEYSRQFKSRARIGLFDFCARRNSSSRLIAAGTSSSNALSLTGKIYKVALTLSVVLVAISTSPSIFSQTMLEYPQTKKQNQVDKFFGVEVADPYRWLEDDVRESKEVEKWVNSENEVTFAYIEGLEHRDEIEKRLTELWDYEKYRPPFKEGDKYYYFKNDGLQNQNVLYESDTAAGEGRVLIDPNTWSDDGTVALGSVNFSDDGKYIAYGIQDAGSDWRTWKIMEVATGELLEDELKWIKFGGISWCKDNQSFYYSRYDEPDKEGEFQSLNLGQKVYLHKLNTPQSDDELVYQNDDQPEWGYLPEVSEDGRYLIITVWKGTDDRYQIIIKPLKDAQGEELEEELTFLIDDFENEFTFIGNEGQVLYFKSDFNAPRKCILTIDLDQPDRENWQVIVPESQQAMSSASMVGDFIVAEYLDDATTQINLYGLQGTFVREVDFPGIGSASGFGGKRSSTETFYSFSSFNYPPTIFRYVLASGDSRQIREAKVDFNSDDFKVSQIFYESEDGTKVPMFLAHKRDIELNGENPTLLYAYGGFNISLTPGFSVTRLQWMEMGGVFAMPNLRGGGEYGKDWHKAGTKTNKQNVFDDFIAAAEWLIDNDYTAPEYLAIQGGSNGGLLVGACMTQRPDLYGACLPAVGVMDMLRFHKFTAGRFWTDDYGCADENKEEFEALYAYSPYHNLKPNVEYPPTLVTTADTDDRVVPGHSFKFAARLQEVQAGENPVLIRIETKAGHGAGKPTSKIIEEYADMWAFIAEHLDMTPFFPDGQE